MNAIQKLSPSWGRSWIARTVVKPANHCVTELLDRRIVSVPNQRNTYWLSSIQISIRKACLDTKSFLACRRDRNWCAYYSATKHFTAVRKGNPISKRFGVGIPLYKQVSVPTLSVWKVWEDKDMTGKSTPLNKSAVKWILLHDPKKANWNLKLNFIECPIIKHSILSSDSLWRFCPWTVCEDFIPGLFVKNVDNSFKNSLEYFVKILHMHWYWRCSPRDCQMSFEIGQGVAEVQILKKWK